MKQGKRLLANSDENQAHEKKDITEAMPHENFANIFIYPISLALSNEAITNNERAYGKYSCSNEQIYWQRYEQKNEKT
jgi:hypothetical protein